MAFFYDSGITAATTSVTLDEATSKHVVQVLRMVAGEKLQLTNGLGLLLEAAIADDNRKRCVVHVLSATEQPVRIPAVCIAISPVKNTARWEWFLEKATELGVSHITPLLCQRTEKTNFRADRMRGILVSAMLQSKQCWLPVLDEPVRFDRWVAGAAQEQKFIAHCEVGKTKQPLAGLAAAAAKEKLALIGPEGDFAPAEIELALEHGFIPVALGDTRLRTETAGIAAATILALCG